MLTVMSYKYYILVLWCHRLTTFRPSLAYCTTDHTLTLSNRLPLQLSPLDFLHLNEADQQHTTHSKWNSFFLLFDQYGMCKGSKRNVKHNTSLPWTTPTHWQRVWLIHCEFHPRILPCNHGYAYSREAWVSAEARFLRLGVGMVRCPTQ